MPEEGKSWYIGNVLIQAENVYRPKQVLADQWKIRCGILTDVEAKTRKEKRTRIINKYR